MKKIIFLLLLLLITLTGCLYTGSQHTESQSKIAVFPTEFDFGEIKQSLGTVSKTFEVENTGNAVLLINRVSTSCGCTTAEIEKKEIQPGKKADLIVTFDPNVHPNSFGLLERVVYIQSNDPINKEIEINIRVTVKK